NNSLRRSLSEYSSFSELSEMLSISLNSDENKWVRESYKHFAATRLSPGRLLADWAHVGRQTHCSRVPRRRILSSLTESHATGRNRKSVQASPLHKDNRQPSRLRRASGSS